MMTPDFIVDVSEADFEYEVVAYSQQVPVVVDFWAEWCGPCKVLGPVLERLATEANGSFRLAKVNVDENPALAQRYHVRSIPAVKAFKDGQVVGEFMGVQPEPRIREFLKKLAPDEHELALEKANGLLQMGQVTDAEDLFRQVLEAAPSNTVARLGLVKSLLLQGYGEESLELVKSFPPSSEYGGAERLRPLGEALVQSERGQLPGEEPLDAAFANALRLMRRGNIPAALDGLLDILRQDKRYCGDKARQVFLSLLELLGEDNSTTRQYRSELASVLF